jgi:hypothetical protein
MSKKKQTRAKDLADVLAEIESPELLQVFYDWQCWQLAELGYYYRKSVGFIADQMKDESAAVPVTPVSAVRGVLGAWMDDQQKLADAAFARLQELS